MTRKLNLPLLLVIFLYLPCRLFSISWEDYKHHYDLANKEWTNANNVIVQINTLKPDQKDSFINLLNTAIGCCERAIQHLDIILNDFASRKKLKEWRITAKFFCEEDKKKYQHKAAIGCTS